MTDYPRREFTRGSLLESESPAEPIELFDYWYREAFAAGIEEAQGCALGTVTPNGRPSVRIVYLREHDARGFVFYTNYHSHKGGELAANPEASLTFWWPSLERQIRIEGPAFKIEQTESDAYFAARPEQSCLGAWASNQSEVIPAREALEERMQQLIEEHAQQPAGTAVQRPPHWGGYRLQPRSIEFWQGRPSRLHDRLLYRWSDGAWMRERLSP
jgi:pyridoxamine 5'-phosphate oxidase